MNKSTFYTKKQDSFNKISIVIKLFANLDNVILLKKEISNVLFKKYFNAMRVDNIIH